MNFEYFKHFEKCVQNEILINAFILYCYVNINRGESSSWVHSTLGDEEVTTKGNKVVAIAA